MKKVIIIGECELLVLFRNNHPWRTVPGGEMLNAAAALGTAGADVSFVGEVASDHVGNILTDYLQSHGVGVRSVDRFTDGVTPATLIFTDDHDHVCHKVRYERYSAQAFDVIWPKIDRGDIVVVGGCYTLADRVSQRVTDIIRFAIDRKAIVVYAPLLDDERIPRITHFKPTILDYLDMASLVVTVDGDIRALCGTDEGEKAYRNHIRFHCFNHLHLDFEHKLITLFTRNGSVSEPMLCDSDYANFTAGAIAGAVSALTEAETFDPLELPTMEAIVKRAAEAGRTAVETPQFVIETSH